MSKKNRNSTKASIRENDDNFSKTHKSRTAPDSHLEPMFSLDNDTDNGSWQLTAEPRIQEELRSQIIDISKEESLPHEKVDVFKKYIAVKEAEVRDLRDQLKQHQNLLNRSEQELDGAQNHNRELLQKLESWKEKEHALKLEYRDSRLEVEEELRALKKEYEDKFRQSGNYNEEVEELHRQKEEWKTKIKEELKRIKLKEKELENKYELLKRDTQTLLDAKDKHVLELKKKNDALEFEMETLEDRLRKSNRTLNNIESKKKRLIETMRLAASLLEQIDQQDDGDAPTDDDSQENEED